MAPFDILASLAMDIFLPVVPAMPSILNTTPSMIQLALGAGQAGEPRARGRRLGDYRPQVDLTGEEGTILKSVRDRTSAELPKFG